MNDFDRDNFVWFTTASSKELEQWYAEADTSDLIYMMRLVQEEITKFQLEEIDIMESELDDYLDQAKNVLNKFYLKG